MALPSPAPAITRTDTRLSSIGAADTLSFMQERLQITLGARRQQVKSATFSGASGAQLGARYSQSATTPSVAILYKAGSRISLYANYAEEYLPHPFEAERGPHAQQPIAHLSGCP